MIEVKEVWLSREPMDMRAGPDTALARVIKQFGKATPHTAYVFANKRGNRVKVLIIDAFGVWLLARRLHQGKFVWSRLREGDAIALDQEQLASLMVGLPWQYASKIHAFDRV
jgi:transposase